VDSVKTLGVKRVALLATDGAVQAGLYARAFEKAGLTALLPGAQNQKMLMRLIYEDIKGGGRGDVAGALTEITRPLLESGVERFVLGCTELPIAFEQAGLGLPTADPARVLARRAIALAGGKLMPEDG
jgi:aspartate racemase